jgi:predicted RNA methylase
MLCAKNAFTSGKPLKVDRKPVSVTSDTKPKGLLAKLYTSVTEKRGLWGTMVFLAKNPLYLYYRYQESHFDLRFNTDTSTILSLEELDLPTAAPATVDANHYQAITVRSFNEMMRAAPIDFRSFVFVDLGSGKGRALMLAAGYPFQTIIGVEFSKLLHDIAVDNIARFRQVGKAPTNIELLCMDATAYEFPDNNVVLFLYNPFGGKTMKGIVDKLVDFLAHTSHKLIVIYRNPKCADLFDRQDALELLIATPGYRIYAGRRYP